MRLFRDNFASRSSQGPERSLEELVNWDVKSIRQFNKGGQAKVFLSSLNSPSERPCKAAFVGQILLRPFFLLSQCPDVETQFSSD